MTILSYLTPFIRHTFRAIVVCGSVYIITTSSPITIQTFAPVAYNTLYAFSYIQHTCKKIHSIIFRAISNNVNKKRNPMITVVTNGVEDEQFIRGDNNHDMIAKINHCIANSTVDFLVLSEPYTAHQVDDHDTQCISKKIISMIEWEMKLYDCCIVPTERTNFKFIMAEIDIDGTDDNNILIQLSDDKTYDYYVAGNIFNKAFFRYYLKCHTPNAQIQCELDHRECSVRVIDHNANIVTIKLNHPANNKIVLRKDDYEII